MAIVDLIYWGCQSNVFWTTDRTGDAGIITQASVPTFSAMALNPVNPQLKVSPRLAAGLDTRYLLYPYEASRTWCTIPHHAANRLRVTHGHTVRLFMFGVGATSYNTHWNSTYTALMGHYLSRALASPAYTALPAATVRILATIHGESDANATDAASYQTNMQTVIAAGRAIVGAGVRAFVHRLNVGYTPGGIYTAQIRTAQAAWVTADGNATLFDQDSYALGPDNTHYSAASGQSCGNAAADAIDALI